jgi:hypothetical protein
VELKNFFVSDNLVILNFQRKGRVIWMRREKGKKG